jgi:hypothetical protein
MKNIGVLLVVVSAVMVSACGSSTPVAATPPVATATSLTLTPATSFMLSGHTETFVATATLSSGGTQVVAPAWSVDNAGVLSIDAAGRATARGTGTSNVIAIYQGQQATRLVRVAPDYQGRWVGTYLVTSCNESGDFQRASFCSQFLNQTQPITLTLTQNLDQVTGTIVLFSSPTGNVSGPLANDGTLLLSGVLPGAVSVTLSNWSTVASGSEMTGVWNMTFAGSAASGTANLAARIISVTKTSALVASELAETAR